MSVVDWIEESVPGGMGSRLGRLLDVTYNIEYGAECTDQSALNLLYLLGYSGQGQLRLLGPSNEKYRVQGGNDRLVAALAAQLAPGQILLGNRLVAISATADGTYALGVTSGGCTRTVVADRVVLALPFTILRTSVDWSRAGFKAIKARAIRELGMGTNSKLHVGFRRRVWEDIGCNGDTYSDRGYQNTWDVSRAQAGPAGVLVDYTGGRIGDSFRSGTPTQRARQFLDQLEPVIPGVTAAWDGRADDRPLAQLRMDAGVVLLLPPRPVPRVRRRRVRDRGRRALLRRAHNAGLSGLPQRRGRHRRAHARRPRCCAPSKT